MAETKTYKGKKGLYYESPRGGGRLDYMLTPLDKTNALDMQNEPGNPSYGQFGKNDKKSEANG